MPAALVVVVVFGGALVGLVRDVVDPLGGDADVVAAVLGDQRFRAGLVFSVVLTVVTTVLAAVLALAVAWALRGRRVATAMAALPVLVPHLLVAVVAVLWAGPGGLLDRVLDAATGDTLGVAVVRARSGLGIVLVYLAKEVPFLALLVLAAWTPDLDDREEVLAVHGAGAFGRWRLAVWPVVRTPLLLGSLVAGAYVFGAFEVPLLVGPNRPPMVAVHALEQLQSADLAGRSRAAFVALLATAVTLVAAPALARSWERRDG